MKETSSPSFSDIRSTLHFSSLKAVQEVSRVRDKLQHKQKPWEREHRMRDVFSDPYYETFRSVLKGESIIEILHKYKAAKAPGEKFVVMDIMGTGSVFANLPPDARPDIVIAMTLVDYRTSEEKVAELQKNIYVIGTDKDDLSQKPTSVALPHTWRKFERLLQQLDITTIDFAVTRPLGGIHTIPSDQPWFWSWMVQHVYQHLNSQEGMILTEAPQGTFDFLNNWAQQANQHGFDITCNLIHEDPDFIPIRPAVKIVKHVSSPEVLK